MELVDTHCHLQFEPYKSREDAVIEAARMSGVTRMICVGTGLEDSAKAVRLAASKKNVWAAVGAHPHSADEFLADKNSSKKLKKLAGENKVVAIGETGLDFYRDHSSRSSQEQAMRAHIQLAQELSLPIIFHVRAAWDDFWRILTDYKNLRGVVHSFSAGSKVLEQILSHNLLIGLNGIMTFSQDEAQLLAVKSAPLDKIVLETDAPFLTPAPNRNELCEPRHVRTIAEFLANLRSEPLNDFTRVTTTNATKLFDL